MPLFIFAHGGLFHVRNHSQNPDFSIDLMFVILACRLVGYNQMSLWFALKGDRSYRIKCDVK